MAQKGARFGCELVHQNRSVGFTALKRVLEVLLECLSIGRQVPKLTRDAARADVFDYIERFYNPKRRHSKLAYMSPMAFEDRAMQT